MYGFAAGSSSVSAYRVLDQDSIRDIAFDVAEALTIASQRAHHPARKEDAETSFASAASPTALLIKLDSFAA